MSDFFIDEAVKKLQDRVRRLELAVARNKPASGIDYNDDGGSFGGGTLTLADILAALGLGTSPDTFLRTTLGGLDVVQPLGTLGATETIDLANASVFWGTMDQDVDVTVVGWTNLRNATVLIEFIEDGTGGWVPTIDGVTWIDGGPTAAAAGEVIQVMLRSRDGGTTIWGVVLGMGAVVAALDDLTDVTLTAPAADEMLQYDGSEWVNSSRRWEPVTFDPGTGPEIVFTATDIVMTWETY
jgi:hypothetical protein